MARSYGCIIDKTRIVVVLIGDFSFEPESFASLMDQTLADIPLPKRYDGACRPCFVFPSVSPEGCFSVNQAHQRVVSPGRKRGECVQFEHTTRQRGSHSTPVWTLIFVHTVLQFRRTKTSHDDGIKKNCRRTLFFSVGIREALPVSYSGQSFLALVTFRHVVKPDAKVQTTSKSDLHLANRNRDLKRPKRYASCYHRAQPPTRSERAYLRAFKRDTVDDLHFYCCAARIHVAATYSCVRLACVWGPRDERSVDGKRCILQEQTDVYGNDVRRCRVCCPSGSPSCKLSQRTLWPLFGVLSAFCHVTVSVVLWISCSMGKDLTLRGWNTWLPHGVLTKAGVIWIEYGRRLHRGLLV